MNKAILAFATMLLALLCSPMAQADESFIRKRIEAMLDTQNEINSVRKIESLGLYEVQIGAELMYTDAKVSYLIIGGELIESRTRKNLTRARKAALQQIKFSDLPLELAVKQVKGNGKRIMATFEDPNCTYCRKLAQDLLDVTDVTIYTFLYPILSADSHELAKNIWCAPDRAKAWQDLMLVNIRPPVADCDHPTEKVVSIGQSLLIRGTPTIFFTDGTRVPGYMTASNISKALDAGSAEFPR